MSDKQFTGGIFIRAGDLDYLVVSKVPKSFYFEIPKMNQSLK